MVYITKDEWAVKQGYASFLTDAADSGIVLSIREDTTVLNDGAVLFPRTGYKSTINAQAIITPTAGSHTYKLRADRSFGGAGGGTFTLKATATAPAFILVEYLGKGNA